MKTIDALIKLASAEVDEQRLVLRQRLNREDAIKAELTALDESVARETALSPSLEDASHAYGAFGAAAVRRREALEQELAEASAAVEAARADLAACFERQKRYEITEENRRRRAAIETMRRETVEADERGLQGHARARRRR